jgi:hypothetical protein
MTDDYTLIGSALERLRERGARGSSCHACAVTLVRSVLTERRDDRCEAVVLVGDVSPTLPYGPEEDAANQREVVRKLAATEITNFTIVSVGPVNDPQLQRMKQLLGPSWGTVEVAQDPPSVASAIVKAVEACD